MREEFDPTRSILANSINVLTLPYAVLHAKLMSHEKKQSLCKIISYLLSQFMYILNKSYFSNSPVMVQLLYYMTRRVCVCNKYYYLSERQIGELTQQLQQATQRAAQAEAGTHHAERRAAQAEARVREVEGRQQQTALPESIQVCTHNCNDIHSCVQWLWFVHVLYRRRQQLSGVREECRHWRRRSTTCLRSV